MQGDSPGNEFDKVVIKGNSSTSIKDGRVGVTDKVRGDDLQSTNTHTETHKHCMGGHRTLQSLIQDLLRPQVCFCGQGFAQCRHGRAHRCPQSILVWLLRTRLSVHKVNRIDRNNIFTSCESTTKTIIFYRSLVVSAPPQAFTCP